MQRSLSVTKSVCKVRFVIQGKKYLNMWLLIASILSLAFIGNENQSRLFLIGDSTMSNKPLADNPERGWGQVFPMFFRHNVMIENYARNGRSTKSFINEGRWQTVLDRLRPGDYVFIQFGHNDEKKEDPKRYAAPQTDYRNNLLKFIRETRGKQAFPVLLTPVSRRKFGADGKSVETHPEYSDVVRSLATEGHVPLIDLDMKSRALLDSLGPEASKSLYLWIQPGLYKSLPNGKQDNTHFTFAGAKKIAGLVVEGMRELQLPIDSMLLADTMSSDAGKGKVVSLDYYYNNEWKTDADGKSVRYHYVWEDTANSGYSELGTMIIDLGADLDTLTVAPTKENLSHSSLYIIVDPDTPAESPHPHYIDQDAVQVLVSWVRSGGILMLMGNDKGNAEFKHFNNLAENFGIHFNEDSRNKVQGNHYEEGAFTSLPDIPLFENVQKIYIKELSTLRISAPAVPLLVDHGDVIIAYAKFGSGAVFAVGDPWFYNEYFGNRKLPVGFENYKAAQNLFRWLLTSAKIIEKS
jgi:lysophospholipase L1-like esterase